LGLTEEEISKNETMWREENNKESDNDPAGSDLRSVGVSVGDLETDEQTAADMEAPPPEEGAMPDGGVAGPVGDAATGGMSGGTPAPAGNGM
jgi:hypothetical protein